MATNISQIALTGDELVETMTGSWIKIGVLAHEAAIIIFDNQGTAPIAISTDAGTSTWRTFPAGEALVLDLRSAQGKAANFAFSKGTTFHGNGASGDFSISYIYAKN